MTPGPATPDFDVLLIGSGLGATAAARGLALRGLGVGIVAGVGRSRSPEADGGLVDPQLVDMAFGIGAPLGHVVSWRQPFTAGSVDERPRLGSVEEIPPRRTYRRVELEYWAKEQAVQAGAVYLDGFIEGQVLPLSDDFMILTEEDGDQSYTARTIVLCEGSDPRIAMRNGLRPDYSPEEQVHFARTISVGPQSAVIHRSGRTRTSWGMPIGVTIVPLGATTMIAVDTRIENVMRAARSTQEALLDLLSSRLGAELGMSGERLHSGIELTALRRDMKGLRLSQDRLLIGLDASGTIDAREPRRADVTIQSGMHLVLYLTGPQQGSWDAFAAPLVARVKAVNPGWHDARDTGFIEEPSGAGGLANVASRIGRGVVGRWRKRAW